jgi:hypothetical protein
MVLATIRLAMKRSKYGDDEFEPLLEALITDLRSRYRREISRGLAVSR